MTTHELLVKAKEAKSKLSGISVDDINRALSAMANCLVANTEDILSANALDIEAAKGNISEVMIDRLMLSPERIQAMADGIRDVAALSCPVGRVLQRHERADGLVIEKTSVALGVVAIIYESRPNVTSDAAALALKSGNVCVLRCGKEAHRSADAIVKAVNGDVKGLIDRVKAIVAVSKNYKTFSGVSDETDGKVDFIFKTDSISKEEPKEKKK